MVRLFLFFATILFSGGIFLSTFIPPAYLSTPDTSKSRVVIEIPAGADVAMTARLLAEKGLIASAWRYELYAKLDARAANIQAGKHGIYFGTNYRQIARLLSQAEKREELNLTIVPGWDLTQMGTYLATMGVRKADWEKATDATSIATWKSTFSFLDRLPTGATLEGYLAPETLRVWKDNIVEGLIEKQLQTFQASAADWEARAKKKGYTLHQMVTLASIIEKEVSAQTDRRLVAGIFWNRLNDGMPLQSDATVNYVTRAGRTRPTLDDLKNTSLYNTYTHAGLPPGPICNPSAASIEAALDPAPTPYRYFLTDPDGKTYFGKTLDEHIANRRKAFRE